MYVRTTRPNAASSRAAMADESVALAVVKRSMSAVFATLVASTTSSHSRARHARGLPPMVLNAPGE